MNSPLVSCVIPIFNAEDWIGETIQSVLNQTCGTDVLEIIIVDDGSTDSSVEVAETVLRASSVQHSTVRLSNGGPARARNTGWRLAKGKWIQFLDADDLLDTAKISIQLEQAVHVASEVFCLYSSWHSIEQRDNKWVASAAFFPDLADPIVDLLKSDGFLPLGAALIRKSCLAETGGFNESIRLIEDVELLLRLCIHGGRLERVPSDRPVFIYRRVPNSLSRRDAPAFVSACARNAKLAEEHLQFTNGLTPERRNVIACVYASAAFISLRQNIDFSELVTKIENLSPHFVPPDRSRLRSFSRVLGYRRALRIAATVERIKRPLSRRLRRTSIPA